MAIKAAVICDCCGKHLPNTVCQSCNDLLMANHLVGLATLHGYSHPQMSVLDCLIKAEGDLAKRRTASARRGGICRADAWVWN